MREAAAGCGSPVPSWLCRHTSGEAERTVPHLQACIDPAAPDPWPAGIYAMSFDVTGTRLVTCEVRAGTGLSLAGPWLKTAFCGLTFSSLCCPCCCAQADKTIKMWKVRY